MVQTLRLPIFRSIDLKTGPRPVFIGTAGPIWPTTGPHARHLWRMDQVVVPLRKTPARGYCGQVCLSENQVGWGLEVHPPPMPPPGGIAGSPTKALLDEVTEL